MLVKTFVWEEERKKKEERRWRNPTFSAVFFSAPAYSTVCSRVFLWTARQYHSLCMLSLGFVASLAVIRVIHNYGKFKFPLPSLNRERYRVLWLLPHMSSVPRSQDYSYDVIAVRMAASSVSSFDACLAFAIERIGKQQLKLKREQVASIRHVYDGKAVFVWLPTGFGKSALCLVS